MSQFYPLAVASVRNETRDTVAVTFAVPAELQQRFRYVQGQHVTLRTQLDGQEVRRSYSICAAAQEQTLRLAIKRTAGGLFSGWANQHLAAGVMVDVMPPMGQFHVPLAAGNRKHYLAFAAGSGITPILSILKTTLLAEPHSRFSLFYGNRASSSVIFRDELADLKDRYLERLAVTYVMSREQQDIELFNGRIDRQKCAQLLEHWLDLDDIDMAFLCGPEEMIDGVSAALQAAGMAKENIKVERFAAGQPRHVSARRRVDDDPLAGPQSEVTVIQDGSHRTFHMARERESVLDAGLRHGIEMRYSCKGGVCSTCRCKLVEGQVEMDANYALEDYEIAHGFVLSCQSFPVTDRIILDFDQGE